MLRLNDLMKRIGKLKRSHQRFGQYAREEIRIPTKLFKKKKNIFIINYYSTSATGFPLLFPEYLNTRYQQDQNKSPSHKLNSMKIIDNLVKIKVSCITISICILIVYHLLNMFHPKEHRPLGIKQLLTQSSQYKCSQLGLVWY